MQPAGIAMRTSPIRQVKSFAMGRQVLQCCSSVARIDMSRHVLVGLLLITWDEGVVCVLADRGSVSSPANDVAALDNV